MAVVHKTVISSVVDLLFLPIRSVEALSRASVLEVSVGGLDSAMSSNNTRIQYLESQLALNNSEIDAAGMELDSTDCQLRFPGETASLMLQ